MRIVHAVKRIVSSIYSAALVIVGAAAVFSGSSLPHVGGRSAEDVGIFGYDIAHADAPPSACGGCGDGDNAISGGDGCGDGGGDCSG